MYYLNNYLLYSYNDAASLFVRYLSMHSPNNTNYFPLFPPASLLNSIDPINGAILYIFFKLFPAVLALNLLAIMYALLNFGFSYFLFKRITNSKFAVLFALLNTFSVYYLYRVISITPNLYQLFFFPLILYMLLFKKTKPYILSLLLFFMFAFSSYYGLFALLTCGFVYFADFIVAQKLLLVKFKDLLINTALLVVPLFLLILIFFYSSFLHNAKPIQNSVSNTKVVNYRPIEEYYSFSTRPWYFVIPPKNSLYFGNLSKGLYKRIEATNYYLADDYTESEAAGSFMGWHFILGVFTCLIIVGLSFTKYSHYINSKFVHILRHRELVIKSLITITFILLFTHPPSFTISGTTFYTPSYLLFYIAPVFRSLVRFSAVIYLLVLILNYLLFLDIFTLLRSVWSKSLMALFFVFLTYYMFAIKLPVIDTTKPPKEFEFARLNNLSGTIVVYPRGDFKTIFWTPYHKLKILNPSGEIDWHTGISADSISKKLQDPTYLETLNSNNVDYLFYYSKPNDNEYIRENFVTVFGNPIYTDSDVEIYSTVLSP
ncbi:MAG: hypothetical protein R3B92_00435 [Patescibacteria group bacterium]